MLPALQKDNGYLTNRLGLYYLYCIPRCILQNHLNPISIWANKLSLYTTIRLGYWVQQELEGSKDSQHYTGMICIIIYYNALPFALLLNTV